MSKLSRGVIGLSLLVSGFAFGTLQSQAVPVAGAGGRILLQSAIRIQDTRSIPSSTVTTTRLGAGQILNVTLVARQTAGTASLHACGAPASAGPAAFVFQPNEAIAHRVLTDANSDCLTSTTPVDFIVDKSGDISDTPAVNRLQYVPLATPASLLDASVSAGSATTLDLGIPTPTEARAAVIALETRGGDAIGFATAFTCGGVTPMAADLLVGQSTTANVAYVPITTTAGPCVFSGGPAWLHLTLLGWLSISGPDTASVPPAIKPQLAPVTNGGGRVLLQDRTRIQDTRATSQDGATTTRLGAGQILNVTLQARQKAGSARLHACGAPSTTGHVFALFQPFDVWVNRVHTDTTSDCLTSTTAVDFLIDKSGEVADTPTVDRLQYVPLATPTWLLDATVSAGSTTPLDLGTPVPAEARAAVVVLQTDNADADGFATAFTCGSNLPTAADLNVEHSATVNVAYVPINATAGPCVYLSSSAALRVRLLGWLSASGPDRASLPPAIELQLENVRPPGLSAITPSRLLDTRSEPAPNGEKLEGGMFGELPFGADAARSISAVVLNVTVDQPEAGGFITLYPCDQARPVTSNLNFSSGQTIANLVTAKLSATGSVCVFSSATTHVIIDFTGGYVVNDGSGSQAVAPLRLLDSRNAVGVPTRSRANADSTTTLHVAGIGGTPATGAQAVTLNVTVDQPETGGFVTVYPCGENVPRASNLNYAAGQTIANLVTVKVGQDGNVCIYTSGSAHLIADLAAWYQPSLPAGFKGLTPSRVLDSRNAVGISGITLLGAGSITTLAIAGHGGVPTSGAEAVTLNITVDQPQGGGFVTIFPCGQDVPTASNLNYTRGQTIANLVNVKLAPSGTVCIYTSASAHVLADVAGYSTTTPDGYWVVRFTHLSQTEVAQPDPTQLLTNAAIAARRFRVG
jgi:hypothetical protein